NVLGLAGGVLVNRDQIGDATALDELGAYGMTGRLGRDHDDVEIGAGHDLVVVDVEAVGEGQHRALLQIGLDVVLVDGALVFVRSQQHDDVGPLAGLVDALDGETGRFRLGGGGGARTQC